MIHRLASLRIINLLCALATFAACYRSCRNGGACRGYYPSAYCDCPSGYTGSYCQNEGMQYTHMILTCPKLHCAVSIEHCFCTFSDLLPKLSKWRNMYWLFLCSLCVSQWVHWSLLSEQRYVCMNCCVCPSEHPAPTYGFQLPVEIRLYFISTWLPCHDPLSLVPSLQSLLTAVKTGSAGMAAHAVMESASVLKEPLETTARSLVSL